MPEYALQVEDPKAVVRAKAGNMRVHFKNTYNVAHAVRGMTLQKANEYLDRVEAKKDIIPYVRFNGHVGRKAQVKNHNKDGVTQGRWPVKSVKLVKDVLRNAESNCDIQNMDPKDLVIAHIQCNRAPKQRRRTYRAHGRIGPYMASPVHIEVVLKPKAEIVARAADGAVSSSSAKLAAGSSVAST